MTVLLVDDEPIMLKRLRMIVPWDDLGYSRVLEAQDGVHALEILAGTAVHLVISDLVMPRMDGIGLIEATRLLNRDIAFIVLTGHDQFEYARRCLRLGVRDYVLKPIDTNELVHAIQAAERETIHPSSKTDHGVQGELPSLSQIWARLRPSSNEIITVVALAFPKSLSHVMEKLPTVLAQARDHVRTITARQTDECVSMFFVGSESECTRVTRMLEQRLQPLKPGVVTLTSGSAHGFASPQLQESIERAGDLSRNRRLFDGSNVSVEKDQSVWSKESNRLIEPDRVRGLEVQLTAALLRQDRQNAGSALKNLIDLVVDSAPDYRVLEYALSDLVMYLSAYTTRGDLNVSPRTVSALLRESVTIEDVYARMRDLIEDNFLSPRAAANASPVQHVDAAKQYIEEHFSEPGLTLPAIADAASLHPGYLSTLFPQYVGKTVVEYLTDRRLDHAVELMRSGWNRLTEIAEASGYRDPYYFSRCFKRRYGEAPSSVLRRFRG